MSSMLCETVILSLLKSLLLIEHVFATPGTSKWLSGRMLWLPKQVTPQLVSELNFK